MRAGPRKNCPEIGNGRGASIARHGIFPARPQPSPFPVKTPAHTRTPPPDADPERLAAEFRRLIAEAERLLGETERVASAQGPAAGGGVDGAQACLASICDAARERVRRGTELADATIREHPYPALALAAGLGLLLGARLGRRPDR